jgi:hypothetical protein
MPWAAFAILRAGAQTVTMAVAEGVSAQHHRKAYIGQLFSEK